jgi:superoxide reductase
MLGEQIQSADWKKEKHVPVIDCPDKVKADELFEVTAAIGKEIGHPNTTEHHIRWIALYFHPEGDKFIYEVGRFEFSAHGESIKGANNKPGRLHALSYCNIHGLWEGTKDVGLL